MPTAAAADEMSSSSDGGGGGAPISAVSDLLRQDETTMRDNIRKWLERRENINAGALLHENKSEGSQKKIFTKYAMLVQDERSDWKPYPKDPRVGYKFADA